MAENHPVAFRWPMKAKVEHGAKIIHVDPRFTRTSAVADIYAPVRAGSDIVFLGGVINYVLNSEKWNTDPFFKTWVVNYTNAATIVGDDFKDTEDLNGVFSGLDRIQGRRGRVAIQRLRRRVRRESWQYKRVAATEGRVSRAARRRPGASRRQDRRPVRPSTSWWLRWSSRPSSGTRRWKIRARSSRSSSDTSAVTHRRWWRRAPGAPRRRFSRWPRRFSPTPARIGRRRSRTPWRGRSTRTASQIIGCCALLQLLLGNVGRPGRRRHGPARPCFHPGLDRHTDPLSLDPGVHVGAVGAEEARHAPATISPPRPFRPGGGPTCRSSWSPI